MQTLKLKSGQIFSHKRPILEIQSRLGSSITISSLTVTIFVIVAISGHDRSFSVSHAAVTVIGILLHHCHFYQPPIGNDRAAELGTWKEREVKVSGSSWDVNCMDVSIAGLGWFSLGIQGEATMKLWTNDGIEITLREPLVLDRAPSLEKPGFWLPKAISEVIGNQTKLEAQRRKKLEDEDTEYMGASIEISA